MPKTIAKTNPATGALIAEVACTDVEDIPAVVAKARAAQHAWGALAPSARAAYVRKVAGVLTEQASSLCQLISEETGKPIIESALNELFGVAHLARYFGKHTARILKPRPLPVSLFVHRRSYLHFKPRGVLAVISPWNFPLTLAMGDVLMALCAGNAVVLKPSEYTPLIGLEIRKIVAAAGIDPELLQVAVGYGDVGAALVRADVDMVHFTGSVATGRKVSVACSERLVPCVLELGGKDAAIVLEDANIEHTARALVFGAFVNAGQACASVERVYAMSSIYKPLLQRVVEITQSLRQGDGSRQDVDVGPMIVPNQLDTVTRHVHEAQQQGATIRTGGQAHGPYYAPTVLTEVHDSMAICQDETFGPVLPMMSVDSVDEAIERANLTTYGLSAAIFTRNVARGRQIAERLRVGTVDINDVLFTHAAPETPWGGLKQSGLGHTHADDGLRHMCETRHVNYSPWAPFNNLWIFPYRRALADSYFALIQGLFGTRPWPLRLGLLCRGMLGIVRGAKTQDR